MREVSKTTPSPWVKLAWLFGYSCILYQGIALYYEQPYLKLPLSESLQLWFYTGLATGLSLIVSMKLRQGVAQYWEREIMDICCKAASFLLLVCALQFSQGSSFSIWKLLVTFICYVAVLMFSALLVNRLGKKRQQPTV